MNFDLGPDDRALAGAIREMCARHFALDDVLATGMSPARWQALEDAGVFTLRVPAEYGGLGLGMAEAAIVFEELGRALVPGPVLGTHVGRARGATEATIALIDRTETVIEHLEHVAVVSVMDEHGLWRVAPGDVRAEPVADALDPFTPLHRIVELPQGERIVGPDIADALRLEATTLTAAFSAGIAAEVTDRAVAYAKEREQFGRPIGSFQAVKHLCADMLVRAEVARAAVYAAACTLDDPAVGPAARAVSGAKVVASEAALENAKGAIQVHGGMGYTWEVHLHYFLKRAAVLARTYGSVRAHESILAASL